VSFSRNPGLLARDRKQSDHLTRDPLRDGLKPADAVRIFVGLRAAPEIASELARLARVLNQSNVRLVSAADVHLTLVPPWNEICIPEAVETLRRVASGFGAFPLAFQHLGYGPQPRRPRFLWVECAASDELAKLRAALLQAYQQEDDRPFRPHVTLARIRGDGPSLARKYPTSQDLSLTQPVESVELFQSPAPGERGYRLLASVQLGQALHCPLRT
jgi:2'-5' RNA ligase